MRSIASYLIYIAALARAAAWFGQNPPAQAMAIALLAAYGAILASEPLLTRRFHRYPFVVLPVQTGLVLALMVASPGMDFLPTLFFPLSFQAVQLFKPRLGMLWIGAFILASAWPLLAGWEWELPGLAMVLLFAGLNFLMGGMAYSMQRAGRARAESQRLLGELGGAYRQLQDYAAQVEEVAAAQERGRLRRELHDSVTQALDGMRLSVQAAQRLAVEQPGQLAGQLDRLEALARQAAGEIQALVNQLQPRPAIEAGLAAALRQLKAERGQRDGLLARLEATEAGQDQASPGPGTAGRQPQPGGLARPALRATWMGRLAGGLVYPVVAVRKLSVLAGRPAFDAALILLAVSLLLYIFEPTLARGGRWRRRAYYLAQGGLILALGWLPPSEDTWALLYLPLSLSAWYESPRREAIAWSAFYAGCLLTTLLLAFDWLQGLGYSLSYLSASAICIAYGVQAVEAERAQAGSQRLLRELQAAHERLKECARQAQELAAAREHERLVRELHDSAGQTIFSITLTVESARLLLERDPARLPEQLGRLQELTLSALECMQGLISPWEPR